LFGIKEMVQRPHGNGALHKKARHPRSGWVERDSSPAASRRHFGPERAGRCIFCMNAATAILPLSPVALTMVQQTSERFI
jgi:hypothetical protein